MNRFDKYQMVINNDGEKFFLIDIISIYKGGYHELYCEVLLEDMNGKMIITNNSKINIISKNKNLRKCKIYSYYNQNKIEGIGYFHKTIIFKSTIDKPYCIIQVEVENSNYDYYANFQIKNLELVKMTINKRKEKLEKLKHIENKI